MSSGYAESRETLFLNPVSTRIAPGYYDTIRMPMCIMKIRLRLQANVELRHEIQFTSARAPRDVLQLLDPTAYGSIDDIHTPF